MFAQPSADAVVYDYSIADNTISSPPIFSVSSNLTDATGSSGGCCIGYYAGKVALFAAVQQSPNMVGIFELKDGPFAWSNCIEKVSLAQQTINLSQGINWFSTNLEITLDDLKAALVEALPNASSTNNIIIKSQRSGQTTYSGTRWRGALNTFDVACMYQITVPESCEITLEGMPINPANHPVTITNGPNWIGFPFSASMTPTDAFAGFAINGDQISSKTQKATYNNRWRGALSELVPGQGYIYHSAITSDRTFTFPIIAK